MYLGLITVILFSISITNASDPDLTIEGLRDCISCICHAKTACYDLKRCAEHSIDYKYFLEAYNISESQEHMQSYQTCMSNESCIVETIFYFIKVTQRDCHCDGNRDCRDMFSRHLHRNSCHVDKDDRYERRFNNCARQRGLKEINSLINCVDFDIAPFSSHKGSYTWNIDESNVNY